MIYDELELKIKQVSADLQVMEETMRANSPAYQRLMGQLDVLIQMQKDKVKQNEELREEDKPTAE